MRNIFENLARAVVLASTLLLCLNSVRAQRLVYRIDLSHTGQHYIDVTVQPMGMRPDTMVFQMPVWSPGVYSEVNYGRFIEGLQAFDSSGKELPMKRVNKDLWKIPSSGVAKLTYRVRDSHEDGSSPEIGLARIDRNGVFANTEALFGYFDNDKGIPGTIILTLPKHWMVATTLEVATDHALTEADRFHQTVFDFDDYESLAQAPLLIAPKFLTTDFTQDGVDYTVVANGNADFPIDSFAVQSAQILRAETSFFRKIPFRNYLFVIDVNDNAPFGIAHQRSSVFTLPAASWCAQSGATEQLLAETLFQTWNGEQFHISPLGPVDYTSAIHAHSLWFSEGVSEYYAGLLRVRYGLISTPEFFSIVDGWMNTGDAASPGSLEILSERLCKNNPACLEALRARGALVALMMDIAIRENSGDRHSLDNVLLRMERDVPTGKTYDDSLLIRTISKYSGTDLSDFYDHYIAGTDPLPVEQYLEKMGAGSAIPASMRTNGEFGLNLALNAAGMAVISAVAEDSLVTSTPLECGDTVCSVNGETVTTRSIAEAQSSMRSGMPVAITLVRDKKDVPVTIRAKVKAKRPRMAAYEILPGATRHELVLRRGLIGHRRVLRFKKLLAIKMKGR